MGSHLGRIPEFAVRTASHPMQYVQKLILTIDNIYPFPGVGDFPVYIKPVFCFGFPGAVNPLNCIQLGKGKDGIEVGQLPDAVQMVNRMSKALRVLSKGSQDKLFEHRGPQHIGEITLDDIRGGGRQQAGPV